MPKSKKIAYALLRVSTPEQSLESQEEKLLEVADSLGYHIPEKYIFREKKTGYDEEGVDRQSIIDLRNSIALFKPDAIFILELSRLTRNGLKVPEYIAEFSLLPKIPMYFADYKLWTIDPVTNEVNRDNVFKLYGAGEAVEQERNRITERTTRGKLAYAKKGYYAGHLSDGYKAVLNNEGKKIIDIDDNRAPIIRRIFELYKLYSVNQIRDILNSEGVEPVGKYRLHSPLFFGYKNDYRDKTGDVKKRSEMIWTKGSVAKILCNEWYIGVRHYKEQNHSIKPIVSRELWDAAQEKIARTVPNPKTGQNVFLLSGLFYCGRCGRKMYGHFAGLDNHYYCSSVESGKGLCSTKGICKENVEGIIKKIVVTKLLIDAVTKADTPVNNVLTMDKRQKKEYQKKIKAFRSIIESHNAEIDIYKNQLKNAILDSSKVTNDDVRKPIYETVVKDITDKINEKQRAIADYEKEIRRYEYAIDRAETAKRMTEKLQSASMEELKEYFNIVINRVLLHNAGRREDVVSIEYNAGFCDFFIYCPQRYKGVFFPIGEPRPLTAERIPNGLEEDWWKITHNAKYTADKDRDVRTTLHYNPIDKTLSFNSYQTLCFNESQAFFIVTESLEDIKRICTERGLDWNYEELSSPITVGLYLRLFHNHHNAFVEYEKIEPLSERAKEIMLRAKEYRKKYNTGKPTCEPYITKDDKYEAVQKERKYLYNRIYKIKQNKSLSDSDKKQMVADIRKRLKGLKYQINYFGDSLRATKYLKPEEDSPEITS